jgi:hypothetical protein
MRRHSDMEGRDICFCHATDLIVRRDYAGTGGFSYRQRELTNINLL